MPRIRIYNMELIIRKEDPGDYADVDLIIRKAFESMEFSDHTEHLLVKRLRKSSDFIPDLSLVAVCKDNVIGHILFTKIYIRDNNKVKESLALAPVAVKPEFQRKGVGSALVVEGHEIARRKGFKSVVVLGHKDYYPRFGYENAGRYNIMPPFKVPEGFYMVKLLDGAVMGDIGGIVEYPEEFQIGGK